MIIRIAGRIFKAHVATQTRACDICPFQHTSSNGDPTLTREQRRQACLVKKREQIIRCRVDNNGHGYTWREVKK